MVESIIVNILVPGIQKRFDFRIPKTLAIGQLISLIAAVLSDEYSGVKANVNQLMMLNLETGRVLRNEAPASQMGLKNGSHLMLV